MKNISLCWAMAGAILVAGCASTQLVDENHRSVHFEKTLHHLDLGGDFFLYADIDGDMEKAAIFFDGLLEEMSTAEPDLDLSQIHLAEIFKIAGFDHIKAIGLSSYKTSYGYRNNAFVLDDGVRTGLMMFLGTQPGVLEIPTWAPGDSDFVYERDLNLKTAFDVVMKILKEVSASEEKQLRSVLDNSIPGMNVTYQKLISSLDTRIFQVVRINDKMLKLPIGSIEIPFVEYAIGLDGLGFLFDDLVESFGANPMISVEKDKNWQIMEVTQSLPGDLGVYRPLVAKDVHTGRVFVATSKSFLDEFKAGQNVLEKSADFERAMRGLPTRGNGLVYSSSRLTSRVTKYLDKLAKQFVQTRLSAGMLRAILPDEGVAVAAVSASLPDGILISSNTTSSHKSTILAAAYANPALIGVLAAIAIPSFIDYIRRSKMDSAHEQVRNCIRAAVDSYDKGSLPKHSLPRICPGKVKTPEDLSGESGLLEYGDALGEYKSLGWVERNSSYSCLQYQWHADVKDDQTIFTCHAWTDLDDDDSPAHIFVTVLNGKKGQPLTIGADQLEGDRW